MKLSLVIFEDTITLSSFTRCPEREAGWLLSPIERHTYHTFYTPFNMRPNAACLCGHYTHSA